jgi:DNA integrity scanning protein DisA with diadenylate cyclase activity/mannitol/fructose-specific phosphotransferase system IIA component (Ntr-type)
MTGVDGRTLDMPLSDRLPADRIVQLAAADRLGALRELAAVAVGAGLKVDLDRVVQTLESREEELSTRIAEGVALPHAVLAELRQSAVAAGFSPGGVEWGSGGETIHLVLLMLAPETAANEHIRLLAELAGLLRQPDIRNRIRHARSAQDIQRVLLAEPAGEGTVRDARKDRTNRTVLSRALDLAQDLGATAVILYADHQVDLDFVEAWTPPVRLLLASRDLWKHRHVEPHFSGAFDVPYAGLSGEHRLEFTLLLAMAKGLVDSRDRVVCVWGKGGSGRLDSMTTVEIAESFHLLLSLQSELMAGDVNPYVLNRLLSLASCISREGREGKAVGSIFVVGQYDAVSGYCRQMVFNPFKGYAEDQRNVLDPRMEETIKEFSVIDGAFVVRGDGVLMSAGTHLSAPAVELELPSGLGARHTAGAAITAATRAVAIVISESTGNVSLYARGQAVMVLPREAR